MKSIQFIGTQRSGSNLLRVMLHQLPEISAPHPPHILQVMFPFLPMYGNLADERTFRRLVDDVCTLVELNPVNWGIQFDREEVRRRCAGNNLPQVAKAVYEIKAEADGAKVWCCKSMANIHYIESIREADIDSFYVHIFRDGRDVALSFLKAIVGEKHVYPLAMQWKKEQELSDALCKKLGPEKSIQIRYEEFVLDPAATVREICARTGIPYSDAVLEYNRSSESQETAGAGAMWSNLVKPVMKENTRKFLKGLSEEQIRIFESAAGNTLVKLGYANEFTQENPDAFTQEELAAFARENDTLKKESRLKADPADIEKRARQDAFIASLKKEMGEFVG